MKITKINILTLCAIILCAGWGGLVAAPFITPSTGGIVLQNQSGQDIQQLLITICNQDLSIQNIADGETVFTGYRVDVDSHYKIKVVFESGAVLVKETGYVTQGVDWLLICNVTAKGMQIMEGKIP